MSGPGQPGEPRIQMLMLRMLQVSLGGLLAIDLY